MLAFFIILDIVLWITALVLYVHGQSLAASLVVAAAIGILSGLTGLDLDF